MAGVSLVIICPYVRWTYRRFPGQHFTELCKKSVFIPVPVCIPYNHILHNPAGFFGRQMTQQILHELRAETAEGLVAVH
ncbi:hypothetical protein D3C79_1039100 [compost metagenome]